MRTIEIEKVTKVTHYEAIDGTAFNNKEECIKYETTAKCVLLAKYNGIVVSKSTEYDLFKVGSDESSVDVVKIQNSNDIDVILQLIALNNPCSSKNEEWLNDIRKRLIDSNNYDSIVFIGRGYKGDAFYLLATCKEIIENINKISE